MIHDTGVMSAEMTVQMKGSDLTTVRLAEPTSVDAPSSNGCADL
jgi:hypothetical protein